MSISQLLYAGVLGLAAGGFGIGVGALLAYLMGRARRELFPMVTAVAVGVIYCLLLFDIFPESLEMGGAVAPILGVAMGTLLVQQLERIAHRVVFITVHRRLHLFVRSSALLVAALALHNFPAGMALGASYEETPELAVDFTLMMVLHGIPEGLAIGLPAVWSGLGPLAVFCAVFAVSLPTGLGAVIGYVFGMAFPRGLAVLLGLAMGAILHVTYTEMLLPAWQSSGKMRIILGLVLGVLAGMTLLLVH